MNDQDRKVLSGLLSHVERNTCLHEATHRGGVIWTICDDCGAKWADDEGGFKSYVYPPEVTAAYDLLGKQPEAEQVNAPDIERELDRMHEDARAVMAGLCANPGGPVQQDDAQGWNLMNCTFDSIAQVAYSLAEAMATGRIKRRAKLGSSK